MIFSSAEFVFAFLPAAFAGFFLLARFLGRDAAVAWLVCASFVFYGWGIHAHAWLLAISVVGNFAFGRAISYARDRPVVASRLLFAGVALNLCLLGYFKYVDFFKETLNALFATSFVFTDLVLPLAISFFTLQQIAYLVDAYRGRAAEYRFLHYALFVSFFPQLIAGPIVHHSEMMPQFAKKRLYRFNPRFLADGLTIFLLGLFKKVALADNLAVFADGFFAGVHGGAVPTFFESWGGALAFGLVIYFDFSAYSDMAIGIGRAIGLRLPENFNAPYQARSIIDFWRRWHMTLSRFLRDYIYIPLGGNRKGGGRRYANLMTTMLIGGLWHGAAWTFVVWGGLHGLYLSLNHLWRRVAPASSGGVVGRLAGSALTFLAVTVAWVFFRAETFADAWAVLGGMAGLNGAILPAQVLDLLPFLQLVAEPASGLPLIAGGTVLGLMELSGFLALGLGIVFLGRPIRRLDRRTRTWLLFLTLAFSVQAVLFGGVPTAFVYFRF